MIILSIKNNFFFSDNKSFKTGLKLSKEYDRNINLNPDSNENTKKLDEYSYDDYSVSCIMENFVKIKIDDSKKCFSVFND